MVHLVGFYYKQIQSYPVHSIKACWGGELLPHSFFMSVLYGVLMEMYGALMLIV